MLKRHIEKDLLQWKNNNNKKCLILEGARQVGKTYIIKKFASEYYENYVELNFVTSPSYCKIFEGDLNVDTILSNITLYASCDCKITPGKTLIFLDEIQACPQARTALKFFSVDGRYDVIASGSILGISCNNVPSYPTGYVEYLRMYPLTFEEFLWANNVSADIISNIRNSYEEKTEVNIALNEKMHQLFRQYIVVGGMPEVVQSFVTEHNYCTVLKLQRAILKDYENDIAKYAESTEKVKARACFKSIPTQLAKENKKFMYSVVEKNSKSSKYLGSINWLIDAGIVNICKNLSRLESPLIAFAQDEYYKIYMNDTGLLVAMLDDGTNAQIIEGDLGIYKGAIFENLIAQVLVANSRPLYFYNRNNSLELDFIIANGEAIIPIEVKAANNKAKSLITLLSENNEMRGIKLVTGNVGVHEQLTTYPVYMAMFL